MSHLETVKIKHSAEKPLMVGDTMSYRSESLVRVYGIVNSIHMHTDLSPFDAVNIDEGKRIRLLYKFTIISKTFPLKAKRFSVYTYANFTQNTNKGMPGITVMVDKTCAFYEKNESGNWLEETINGSFTKDDEEGLGFFVKHVVMESKDDSFLKKIQFKRMVLVEKNIF